MYTFNYLMPECVKKLCLVYYVIDKISATIIHILRFLHVLWVITQFTTICPTLQAKDSQGVELLPMVGTK